MPFTAILDVGHGLGGVSVSQVATLTCDPKEFERPIDHRIGVIVAPEKYDTWLGGSVADVAPLVAPLDNGLLQVESAQDLEWYPV